MYPHSNEPLKSCAAQTGAAADGLRLLSQSCRPQLDGRTASQLCSAAMHPDLVPYHLACNQPDLMPELGPPDFYPLVPVSRGGRVEHVAPVPGWCSPAEAGVALVCGCVELQGQLWGTHIHPMHRCSSRQCLSILLRNKGPPNAWSRAPVLQQHTQTPTGPPPMLGHTLCSNCTQPVLSPSACAPAACALMRVPACACPGELPGGQP